MADDVISKSMLADELRVTRAAVSDYVRRGLPVRPDGKLNRSEAMAWVGRNILPNHHGKGASRAGHPPTPQGFEALDRVSNAVDQGAVVMGLSLAYRLGAQIASLAVYAGAPLPVAYALKAIADVAVVGEVEDILRRNGMEPVNSDPAGLTFDLECFDQVDWKRLAKDIGERFDEKACKRFLEERKQAFGPAARAHR